MTGVCPACNLKISAVVDSVPPADSITFVHEHQTGDGTYSITCPFCNELLTALVPKGVSISRFDIAAEPQATPDSPAPVA